MPAQTAIDQAAASQNGNRQATLDAIAQGGRAGRTAYQTGQANVHAAGQQAMGDMAGDSYGVLNSPGSDVTHAAQRQMGDVSGQYESALGRLQGAFSNNMATAGRLNTDYFAQTAASAPAYRAMADEQIAEARARWQAQKEAHDAAEARAAASGSGSSLPEWKLKAEATGLGEDMAGSAVQHGREIKHDARGIINENTMSMDDQQLMASAVAQYKDATGQAPTPDVFDDMARQIIGQQALSEHRTGQHGVQKLERGREVVQDANATPEWAWQRAAADAMGVDPYLAAGIFQPPTAGEQVNSAQDQRQLDYLNGPGGGMFESPQAQRDYGNADYGLSTGGLTPQDPIPMDTAAQQLGIHPDDAAAMATDPAFRDAIDTFNDGTRDHLPLATINADLQQYLTDQYGQDYPQIRQLVSMMYGHLAG